MFLQRMPFIFVFSLAWLLAACGNFALNSDNKVTSEIIKIFWPTADISDSEDGWVDKMDAGDDKILGSGKWDNRFYLTFAGAELSKDDSFIIAKSGRDSLSIPAFSASDLGTSYSANDTKSIRQQIVTAVKAAFADFNVNLSTEKPESPFSTVYIGGDNFIEADNVLGVAPLDLSNFSGTDKIFVFSKPFSTSSGSDSLETLVNVTAHEIAHSLGARHISSEKAALNPVVQANSDEFNVAAKVVGTENELENTRDLLLRTAGAAADRDVSNDLPVIKDLTMSSDGDVGQLSIFSAANATANPNLDLNEFDYQWTFAGKNADGPTVRVLFEGKEGSTFDVELIVSNSLGQSATYAFEVTKRSL